MKYMDQFWTWLEQAFQSHHRQEIYEWLSQSADVVELEHRMRILDRNGGWI
jgi:hypothetical protein